MEKNVDTCERQRREGEGEGEVRSSTRKRTSSMMVSDDESSTDKSTKITRTRYTKPPSETGNTNTPDTGVAQVYWKRRIVQSVSNEYEDEYDYPPQPAQSEPSIGNNNIQSQQYEDDDDDEASSHDYDLSQPNHHNLHDNAEEDFSNSNFMIHTAAHPPIKFENKSMAESDYGFPTPNHHETARKPAAGSEKQTISNSRAPNPNRNGMGENQNPWIAECDHGADFLKFPIYTPHPHQPQYAEEPGLNRDCSYEKQQHAQPLIRAAWLGSFTINSDWGKVSETFDGLQGYVSCKACPMVRLVAGKLPEAIRWEKLPKYYVWPKGFQRQGGPTDDDIAVFFFPSLAKDEDEYDSFVLELIRGDFALRTTVMGSELLVFTSVDLPPLFTRFQGKLYLWGVFRGNQPRLF